MLSRTDDVPSRSYKASCDHAHDGPHPEAPQPQPARAGAVLRHQAARRGAAPARPAVPAVPEGREGRGGESLGNFTLLF